MCDCHLVLTETGEDETAEYGETEGIGNDEDHGICLTETLLVLLVSKKAWTLPDQRAAEDQWCQHTEFVVAEAEG